MPSRREIEKEIQKINKEIAKLHWDIKNEVLTPRQKAVKNNKIKELKKMRKVLMKQVEGGEFGESPPRNSRRKRYIWNPEQVSHHPRWKNGEVLPMNRLTSSHLYALVYS